MDRIVPDSTKRITGAYGWITLPDGTLYNHKGVDIGWRTDENQNIIFCNCYGVVEYLEDGLNKGEGASGWGNYVLVRHPNGMYSRYCHLRKGLPVHIGQEVDETNMLGVMGESGNVTARHLHFEVQTNKSADSRIDPTPYLSEPIWSNSPEPPKPVERKFKVGDKVVLNGHLYADSYGNGKGQMRNDYVTTIGIVNNDINAIKPYNVGDQEGWVDERNLKLYTEPTPQPTPEIVRGTRVRVIGDGYGTSYGESPMCKYRYEGYIGLEPMLDRPYPYCVYDDEGPMAWYRKEDLEIIQ